MHIPDRVARVDAALGPLIAELTAAGVRLSTSRTLGLLHKEDYPTALPILLDHLAKPHDDVPRAVIAQSLCLTKNSHLKAIWPKIAQAYAATPNEAKPFEGIDAPTRPSQAKLMLANALLRLYEPKRLPLLIDLVRAPENGETRVILLTPLLRIKTRKPDIMDLLKTLVADPQLEPELSARGITPGA